MDEKNLQRKCVAICKSLGILVHKVESRSSRGFPDLLLVLPNGTVLFIELKSPSGKGRLSELQRRMIQKLRRNNAHAYCVDNEERFREIIAEFIE